MDTVIQNGVALNQKSILQKVDSTPTSNSENLVTSGGTKAYVDQKDSSTNERINTLSTQIASGFFFKGSSTYSNLPASGNTVNDTYYVTDVDKQCWYSWNGTEWIQSSMSQADYAGLIAQLKADMSSEFSTAKTYNVGDYCLYGSDAKLYVCTTAITETGTSWDASKWQEVSFADAISDIVLAQDTQPESISNKIWIDTTDNPDTVDIPTMEEFEGALDLNYPFSVNNVLWDVGTISQGQDVSNSNRIRTVDYVDNILRIKTADGYDCAVIAYDRTTLQYAGRAVTDGTISSDTSKTTDWVTSYDLYKYPQYKFRLVLRVTASPSEPMDVSQSVNMLFALSSVGQNEKIIEYVESVENDLKSVTESTNNILNPEVFLGLPGISIDENGYYVGKAQAFDRAFAEGIPGLVFESNKTYFFSCVAYTDGPTIASSNGLIVRFYDEDNTLIGRLNLVNNKTTPQRFTLLSTNDNTTSIGKLCIGKSSSASNIWHIKDVMVIQSDVAIDYVPHNTAVDLVARKSIGEQSANINLLKQEIDSLQLPKYYVTEPTNPESFDDIPYIDQRVQRIPEGKHFMFFTDVHWKKEGNVISNAKKSPLLIDYISKRVGIKNTVFGGDVINQEPYSNGKYLANNDLLQFSDTILQVCEDRLLPVMGNHDNNLGKASEYSGDTGDLYLPGVQVQKALFNRIPKTAHTYWETYGNDVLQFAHAGGIADTAENNAELEANCKLTYYYDDDEQEIRYIVLDSTRPLYGVWAKFIGGENADTINTQESFPYIPWLYRVLHDTPEGYDVVIAQHSTDSYSNIVNQTSDHQYIRTVSGLAMGVKVKANKKLFYNLRSRANGPAGQLFLAKCPGDAPAGAANYVKRYFDFTDCANIGRIFIICGHNHGDLVGVFHPRVNEDNYNYYVAEEYTGGTIDQTNIVYDYEGNEPFGCDIPCIWTTTDARGQYDGSYTPMTLNTITEQAIDVFSLVDYGIDIARIGAYYVLEGSVQYERKVSRIDMVW